MPSPSVSILKALAVACKVFDFDGDESCDEDPSGKADSTGETDSTGEEKDPCDGVDKFDGLGESMVSLSWKEELLELWDELSDEPKEHLIDVWELESWIEL